MIKKYLGIAMADLSTEYCDSLEKRIYKYFPPIEVDIWFADALTSDDWGQTHYDLGETWKTWVEIPFDIFKAGCQAGNYFLGRDEFAMLLPKYLIEMISKNIDGYIGAALDSAQWNVEDWIEAEVLFIIFHPEQVKIIIDVIDYYDEGIKNEGECNTYELLKKWYKKKKWVRERLDAKYRTNRIRKFWIEEKVAKKITSWADFDMDKGGVWVNSNPYRASYHQSLVDKRKNNKKDM